MNAHQAAFLNMCSAVKAACNAHSAVWSTFTSFDDAFADFLALIPQAVAAAATQNLSTKGDTEQKAANHFGLGSSCIRLRNSMILYATLHNQPTLLKDAHRPDSAILDGSTQALASYATTLIDLYGTLPANALATLGFPAIEMTTLEDAQTAFTGTISAPRSKRSIIKEGTAELAAAIKALREVLTTRMDIAAAALGNLHPVFYREYLEARQLVKPATHPLRLVVKVTDSVTGLPLPGVHVTLVPGGVVRYTSQKGGIQLRSLADGAYQMTLSTAGYQTRVVPVYIATGQKTTLNEQMTPLA